MVISARFKFTATLVVSVLGFALTLLGPADADLAAALSLFQASPGR